MSGTKMNCTPPKKPRSAMTSVAKKNTVMRKNVATKESTFLSETIATLSITLSHEEEKSDASAKSCHIHTMIPQDCAQNGCARIQKCRCAILTERYCRY